MKHFQKLKCECKKNNWDEHKINHIDCSGFIKGADISDTMNPILDEIKNNVCDCDEELYRGHHKSCSYIKAKKIILANIITEEE